MVHTFAFGEEVYIDSTGMGDSLFEGMFSIFPIVIISIMASAIK